MAAAMTCGQPTPASLTFRHGLITSNILGNFQASSLMEPLRHPASSAGQLPGSLPFWAAIVGLPYLDGTPTVGQTQEDPPLSMWQASSWLAKVLMELSGTHGCQLGACCCEDLDPHARHLPPLLSLGEG